MDSPPLDVGVTYRLPDAELYKRNIGDICKAIHPEKYADWTRSPNYYIAQPFNLSYCIMNYDMDDIWLRIFDIFRNPERINAYQKTKFPTIKPITPVKFENRMRKESETVLYVRNPYVRLYIAYYDRFYLTFTDKKCETISFQEFLDKIITHVKLRQNWGTSWFAPLVPKCRLCDIKIFSVVKEENFQQDFNTFTRDLEETLINKTLSAEEFLQTEKWFMLAVLRAKISFMNPSCRYSNSGQTLWRSLQFMGMINYSVPYPNSLKQFDISERPDILVKAVLKAGYISLTEAERLTQKQTMLAEAYRGIKDETIQYLQDIYRYDFEMFGYSNKRPV